MDFKQILAPTDLSPFGEAGVQAAAELAQRLGARLILLHVVSPKEVEEPAAPHVPRRSVDQVYEKLQEEVLDHYRRVVPAVVRQGISAETQVVIGTPVAEILTMARVKEVDLIAMGTHGRTGVARLVMGSVAEEVLRRAPCPVLTVRPQEAMAQMAA
jgi:nucleotide-binding universal stress UspA family protein